MAEKRYVRTKNCSLRDGEAQLPSSSNEAVSSQVSKGVRVLLSSTKLQSPGMYDFFIRFYCNFSWRIASHGANAQLIDSLPNLEIIANYSVRVDKIDLGKCKERGIRVRNTPDVLTDDVADLGVGLILATLQRICVAHNFLKTWSWIYSHFPLST